MAETTEKVARRNSLAIAALEEYMELRDELARTEDCEQDCSCDSNNFHTCDFCKERGAQEYRQRQLLEGWGDNWAVMLNEDTLPFQDWCACGHISGQHASRYPHVCAVDDGCEKECYGFRSRLGQAAPELLEALKRICAAAESWHKETGHEDDDPVIKCDAICDCIPQMKAAIRKAEGQ